MKKYYIFILTAIMITGCSLSDVNVEKIDKCDETFGKCKKLTNLIFKTDFENKKQELLNKFQIENPGICCFLG